MNDNKVSSTLYMLKAEHGDAFLLNVTDGEKITNVIIDSGPLGSYLSAVKPVLDGLDHIDLCIITHFDEDHSRGLVAYLTEDISRIKKFGELWINAPYLIKANTSDEVSAYSMCDNLSELLSKYESDNNCTVECHDEVIVGTTFTDKNELVRITVLSPTADSKEKFEEIFKTKYPKIDTDSEIGARNTRKTLEKTLEEWAEYKLPVCAHKPQEVNDCSISCLIETNDKSYLMLGDIREEIVIPWLEEYKDKNGQKLKVDYMKIPHHGSMKNISEKLLNLVDCSDFIISTNGRYGLPDRYTIAKILLNKQPFERDEIKIFFNYERECMECCHNAWFLTDEEEQSGKYNFKRIVREECE